MPHIFAGADRQQIDPEVLEIFKGLPDDFWVFAEFTISRNIDWFIIHPHADGTLALIAIELKRTTLPLSGDINNAWRQWTPEGWRELALSGPYRNYYWQAVEAANKLKEWLWNNQRRFRLGQELLNQDAFKIWPDLLILSPTGVNHQLPLHPPNNFGKFIFSLDECMRHITTWRSRQLSLVPLVDEELFRLAEALGLEQIWPTADNTAPTPDDLSGRVQALEVRVRQLEAQLSQMAIAPAHLSSLPHPTISDDLPDWQPTDFAPVEPLPAFAAQRSIARRRDGASEGSGREARNPPSKEIAFGWVEELLHQHGTGQPIRLADLGNSLKSRHNFDARLQLGLSLTELLSQFEKTGRIRLSYRERVPYVMLANDDMGNEDGVIEVGAAKTFEAEEVVPTDPIAVRQKLGREGLMIAAQIIAAVEDLAGGRVAQTASFLKHLRESLPLNGVSALSNGEANRLLREEFVALGYLRTVTVRDIDLATGDLYTAEGYRLNRDHPAITIMLTMGAPILKEEIEVRTFAALSEEAPAAG